MENLYLENIENIKKRFIRQYNMTTYGMLVVMIILFHFYIYIPLMVYYFLGGLIFLGYSDFLTKNRYSANQIISAYMIIAPLYHFYILFTFWNNSISLFVTLFPLPLAAYVFFSKKMAVYYFLYMLANIFLCFLAVNIFDIHFEKYTHNEVIFTDSLNFAYTLIIIILIFICHDKINKIRIQAAAEGKPSAAIKLVSSPEKVMIPVKAVKKEIISPANAIDVFEELDRMMTEKKLFKDPKLNISKLSLHLDINYNHLSKIIRNKGYQNFNMYLNEYRINYVKKLISENNLQKVTLMYIYTEAGFSNQATFNRVFKQIEGVTPSEYITKNADSANDRY